MSAQTQTQTQTQTQNSSKPESNSATNVSFAPITQNDMTQIYQDVQPNAKPTEQELQENINNLNELLALSKAKQSQLKGLMASQGEYAQNIDQAAKNLIEHSKKTIADIDTAIGRQWGKIMEMRSEIEEKNEELANKQYLAQLQDEEIRQKSELVETRNRMLELSQERNVYKQKIIYTLIAIVIAIISLLLISYSFLRK